MATIIPAPPALAGDLTLFHTTDPLLANSPVLVFHGPAATLGATSSRIQVHIFTPAGQASYTRLSVSPASPFYTAVSNLPREEQGDEVCRGLAFALKKYFTELPENLRARWCDSARVAASSLTALYGDAHVAILATRMNRVENADKVLRDLAEAYGEQHLSWCGVDVVLPPGTMQEVTERPESAESDEPEARQLLKLKFGRYADLVAEFGPCAFLPTKRLKRAPSRANTLGRSASFLRNHKENARKQVGELLATEESYVARLKEAQEIQAGLHEKVDGSDLEQLGQIFPTSLPRILELNTKFLEVLAQLVEETEATSQEDIATTPESQPDAEKARQDFLNDAQGVGAIGKCFCEWLPQMAEAYQDYMRAHADASQLLRTILRAGSALGTALQAAGEQKLTSLLIEPVQRLPRYNLYIDGISKQLPIRHPALRPLLKARDIITTICAESEEVGTAAITQRLASRCTGWPEQVQITGRLVAAVDCTELMPPYDIPDYDDATNILLLFTDQIMLLERLPTSTTSARVLQTELENGSLPGSLARAGTADSRDFAFLQCHPLDTIQCTESHQGRAVQIRAFDPSEVADVDPVMESWVVLRLQSTYEGKAHRFVEEVCKAEAEHRFSEPERESIKWEFRATEPIIESLGLYSAVFENSDPAHIAARAGQASIRVLIDIDRHADRLRAGKNGIRTVIALSPTRDGLWRITVDALDGTFAREHLGTQEIVPSIRRKLAALLASRLTIDQSPMTAFVIGQNSEILRSLDLQTAPTATEPPRDRADSMNRTRSRSRSPRKLLSNFLSNVGPAIEPPNLLRREMPVLSAPSLTSRLPVVAPSKPPSRESRPSSRDVHTPKPVPSLRSMDTSASTFSKLEDTMSAYILALRARKGNIVGKNLKMRSMADELAVNELYNSLLEDPQAMALAGQATVDVLFAAFEKFVNVGWKECFGPVMPVADLQGIQLRAESLFPADFDEHVRLTLEELPPPNRRAFKAIMNLLAELLDGTGNDGDRGILTAAFAEVLVTEGNPHDYIALIDRFVNDTETYFGEPLVEAQKQQMPGAAGGHHRRARSVNSASISSNHSSLRKKFGLGVLSRENSKSEAESKVSSAWWTLSKGSRTDASPASSISKGSRYGGALESDRGTPSRPSSQDGSRSVAFSEGTSSHSLGLSTIGEHPSFIPTAGPVSSPRKKRRSSLSDLKPLELSPKRETWGSPSARHPTPSKPSDDKSLPASPMPSTPSSRGGSGRLTSPSRMPRPQLPPSFRREASPGPAAALNVPGLRLKPSGEKPDEVVITSRHSSLKAGTATAPAASPSPLPRTGLAERHGAGNIIKRPSPQPEKMLPPSTSAQAGPSTTQPPSPRKMRIQSPQKLREQRLQQPDPQALSAAHGALQSELQSVSDELNAGMRRLGLARTKSSSAVTATNATASSSKATSSSQATATGPAKTSSTDATLRKKMSSLEAQISAVQTLVTAQAKYQQLEVLYKEVTSENEALYARFNDELARIVKAVRGGDGVEELKRQLKESQAEAAALRRETSRLKRENLVLRAQGRGEEVMTAAAKE